MSQKVDIRMSVSVCSQIDNVDVIDNKPVTTPSLKAQLLYAAPKSDKLAPLHFKHEANQVRLIKFLRRTNLVDVSLKVLSIHYAQFIDSSYICGKVVYNQLAQLLMHTVAVIEYSIKSHEIPLKQIRWAKSLITSAAKFKTRDQDFEFLRYSKIDIAHIEEDAKFAVLANYKAALTSQESYLSLLNQKYETYRYKEDDHFSDAEDQSSFVRQRPDSKNVQKTRKSARIDQDFKRIGMEDEFSQSSSKHASQVSLHRYYPSKRQARRNIADLDDTLSNHSNHTEQPESKARGNNKRISSRAQDTFNPLMKVNRQPRLLARENSHISDSRFVRRRNTNHQKPSHMAATGRREPSQQRKWQRLQFYFGQSVDQLTSGRPQAANQANKDNLLNSIFCQDTNAEKHGRLAVGKAVDESAFVMDAKQLDRLANFDLNAFVSSFANDKQFKTSLQGSILYLQNSINLEAIQDEMEKTGVDFSSIDQLKIACEDFIEEFRARSQLKNSNQKMLNLCFAVLWVFLSKVSDQQLLEPQFKEIIEINLVGEFLPIFAQIEWKQFQSERDLLILVVSMLVNFLLKHKIQEAQIKQVFEYLLDQALISHTLRVTDYDIQRMLLKKEARFVFILMSLLSQLHHSSNLQSSFFEELVQSSMRFKYYMMSGLSEPTTFQEWQNQKLNKMPSQCKDAKSQSILDVTLHSLVLQYAVAKTISSLLACKTITIEWETLLQNLLLGVQEQQSLTETQLTLSDITLHLLSELQNEASMSRDQLILLVSKARHSKQSLSLELIKKATNFLKHGTSQNICLAASPICKLVMNHIETSNSDEKQLKQLHARLIHSLQKAKSDQTFWAHMLLCSHLRAQTNIIFIKMLELVKPKLIACNQNDKQTRNECLFQTIALLATYSDFQSEIKVETCTKLTNILDAQFDQIVKISNDTMLPKIEKQMRLDSQIRILKQVLKATYFVIKRTKELSLVQGVDHLEHLLQLVLLGVRQDQLNKAFKYWFRALNTVIFEKASFLEEGSKSTHVCSQDVEMISDADLEACLFDNNGSPKTSSQVADTSQKYAIMAQKLEEFAFKYLKNGRDSHVVSLIFKAIGSAQGKAMKLESMDRPQIEFFNQLQKLESSQQQSINAALLSDTSKPMMLAHVKLSFFRGLISHHKQFKETGLSYQLLECLVRALLDKHLAQRTKNTLKFYREVSTCSINLTSKLEGQLWQLFLSAEVTDVQQGYESTLQIFRNFFQKVNEQNDDLEATFEIVFKYVALIPILFQSALPHDTEYLDFLKQLMLALVVSFQHALKHALSRLSGLIHSLRTLIMPQSFKDRSSIQASNKVLLLSPEAIYVFQYLALMNEPASDYLNNMLNFVHANLNTLVPGHVLGVGRQDESPLSLLFAKISKTDQTQFFAQMLDQLICVDQANPFLCAVIMFKMVIQECGQIQSILQAANRFIAHEIQKLKECDKAFFDCKSNLCLLAFLNFCECLESAKGLIDAQKLTTLLCCKVLLSQASSRDCSNICPASLLQQSRLPFQLSQPDLIERLVFERVKHTLLQETNSAQQLTSTFIRKQIHADKQIVSIVSSQQTPWSELFKDLTDAADLKIKTFQSVEDLIY